MASGKVKGITIAMEADTTGVTKGLKEITSQSIALSKDLKSVNSLLKLDPSNTTLLAEKQKILADSIETAKQKLIALKGAQEDVNKAYAAGDLNTEQYLAYQKELVQTEKQLNSLESELKDSENALDKTGDEAKDTAGDFDDTKKSTGELGEALANGFVTAAKAAAVAVAAIGTAAVAAVKGIVDAAAATAEYGDNVDKMSQKIGISAEAYQEWDFIMQHSGASVDSLQAGMKTLSTVITDAGNGSASAAEKLAAVGLSIEDLQGKSGDEQLNMIITALQGMGEGADRTAAATDLLGKSATELGALLNTSAEDTEAMRQQVHDLGAVMSDDAVKASAGYQDSLQNLQTAITGAKNNLVADFLPAITEVMDGLTGVITGTGSVEDLAKGIEDFADQLGETADDIIEAAIKILPELSKAIVKNLPDIITAGVDIIKAIVKGVVDALPEIMPAIIDLIKYIGETLIEVAPQLLEAGLEIILELADALVDALPEMIPAIVKIITELCLMLTEPDTLIKLIDAALQIIIALGEGLIKAIPILLENLPIIIENIITALIEAAPMIIDAGVQLLSSLVANLPEITARILLGINELVNFIGSKFGEAWAAIQEVFAPMVEFFANIWQGIKDIFFAVVDWFKERFESAWKAIKNAWASVTRWFRNIWTGIKNVFSAVGTWFKEKFTAAWTNIKNAWSGVTEWFGGIWTGISDTFSGVGTWFKEKFDGAWTSITGAFSGVSDFFDGIWNTIAGTFTGLGDKSAQWGKDLIDNFISGIEDMWDDLVKTVTGVADVVKDFIGFSEPDKGPLSDFHTFAPDMIELFCEGLKKNTGKLEQAMASSLGTAMNGLENLASVEVNGATAALPAQTVIDNSRTVYQTNNSPKPLSRLEIYRQTRNAVNMT